MIQVDHPGSGSCFFYPSRIPDPGVKKAPDPVSGSATLAATFFSPSLIPDPIFVQPGSASNNFKYFNPKNWF